MKKTILFKTLVDILYFLHFIGLLGIILILPFGIVNINQACYYKFNNLYYFPKRFILFKKNG